MKIFACPGTMYHAPWDSKFILLVSNLPFLLIAKKNFWIGISIFLISSLYHYKQNSTPDVKQIDRVCAVDVVMNFMLIFYLLFTNTVETLSYTQFVPILIILCMPYHYGLQDYYAELHSLWHIVAAMMLVALLT